MASVVISFNEDIDSVTTEGLEEDWRTGRGRERGRENHCQIRSRKKEKEEREGRKSE